MGSFDTFDQPKTIREDLSDLIFNIAPMETPMLTSAGIATARQVKHEWLMDVLLAPQDNAVLEGDDPTAFDGQDVTRLNNQAQISRKAVKVTGSMEAVVKAGMDSQMAYQTALRSRELKTDVDFRITAGSPMASVPRGVATPGKSARFEAWITNSDRGAGGADPAPNDGTASPTDGTPRNMTQANIDNAYAKAWAVGGRPSIMILGAHEKAAVSKLDGLGNAAAASTMRTDRGEGTIYATADVYIGNFGQMFVLPTRQMRKSVGGGGAGGAVAGIDRNIDMIDPEYLKIAYLRPWQQVDLAITGDNVKREILVEWTLQMSNFNAHAIVADLQD